MSDEDDKLMFEGTTKGKVNWGYIILRAIDRVDNAAQQPLGLDERARDAFYSSVRALDSILSHYKTKEYEEEKKRIASMSEPKNRIATVDEFFEWYSLCCKLVNNAGLLPPEDKVMKDEYDEAESGFFQT